MPLEWKDAPRARNRLGSDESMVNFKGESGRCDDVVVRSGWVVIDAQMRSMGRVWPIYLFWGVNVGKYTIH